MGDMQIRFRYLVEDRDRHGNIRLYVRVPGRTKVRIKAPFGTDEFVAAYNAAVSDHVRGPRQAREVKPGSFRHLCAPYYAAPCSSGSTNPRNHGVAERWMPSARSTQTSRWPS